MRLVLLHILDPESMMIEAIRPSVELSLTEALEGCAPKNVVPSGRPAVGLSWMTSDAKVLASVEPNLLLPLVVSDNFCASIIGNWDNGRKSI